MRPRFTILDAVENLHRLDKDFLKELVTKHKSGLDILAGAEQFERPNAQDAAALEEVLRVLTRIYDFIVVDAGNIVNACALAGALRRRHPVPRHESRTCRRCATRSGSSSACVSSAPVASGSACC